MASGPRAQADSAPPSPPGARPGRPSTPSQPELITRLFPKCRPRQDVNLNPLPHPRSARHDLGGDNHNDMDTADITDSRIIEIAGGREVYSQSRSKASRKGRHLGGQRSIHTRQNNKHRDIYLTESNSNRHRDDRPVSPVICNFPVQHSPPPPPVPAGPAPCEESPPPAESPPPLTPPPRRDNKGSPIAVTAGGEVVVFDDIGENWQGLRLDFDNSDNELDNGLHRTMMTIESHNALNSHKHNTDTGKSSPAEEGEEEDEEEEEERSQGSSASESDSSGEDRRCHNPAGRGQRVIGGLPIAEYAESPRRYGPPRPGFPQRVLSGSSPSPPLPPPACLAPSSTTFDYLYEFSETRKVLEEFFKCPKPGELERDNGTLDEIKDFQDLEYELRRHQRRNDEGNLVSELDAGAEPAEGSDSERAESRTAGSWYVGQRLAKTRPRTNQDSPHTRHNHTNFLGLQQDCDPYEPEVNLVELSVGTGSSGSGSRERRAGACTVGASITSGGGATSQVGGVSAQVGGAPSQMGGVSGQMGGVSGQMGGVSGQMGGPATHQSVHRFTLSPESTDCDSNCGDLDSEVSLMLMENEMDNNNLRPLGPAGPAAGSATVAAANNTPPPMQQDAKDEQVVKPQIIVENGIKNNGGLSDADLNSLDPLASRWSTAPPPPAPEAHRVAGGEAPACAAALRDIRLALRRARALPAPAPRPEPAPPVLWLPRRDNSRGSVESAEHKPNSGDEDEADTDLETDRLLGQQRTDDQGFYDDKAWKKGAPCQSEEPPPDPPPPLTTNTSPPQHKQQAADLGTTDSKSIKDKEGKKKGKNKEVLIEGVLFRARYLGSTQLVCEGQPTKATRMLQAEEAVSRIKALAPEGESQPSTEVDLFISTEKIMVLNTDLKEIMMDHALRTISYIADIGDLVVLMARRRFVPHEMDDPPKVNRTPKMICHVFESEEAQFIAQSIGQAFQVAYMEFLKANGIEDHSFVKEMDYQEVLNSQEIFGDELQMFAKKEMQKEVVVPKAKGEILGVVIVESGWGSMLPTVVIANLAPAGAAARCGQLNIGDQIIAINGVSLVGLPLSTCQTYIKNSKNQTVVKLTVVPCAPVVEVKIKRPDTKYQLGFSVQNGVICSLLRGGIAERGGVRVGHRIIEINNQSVVAVPHERIVNLLATSVGEILMKTMPTSMFRLLTGQENPVYI